MNTQEQTVQQTLAQLRANKVNNTRKIDALNALNRADGRKSAELALQALIKAKVS